MCDRQERVSPWPSCRHRLAYEPYATKCNHHITGAKPLTHTHFLALGAFLTPISSHLAQSDTHFLVDTRNSTPISSHLNVFDTHFLALAHPSKTGKVMKTGGLHNIFTKKMVLQVSIGCSVAHDSFDTHFLALSAV